MEQAILLHKLIDWGLKMSKYLYIDGKFGISGDMLCGALLDLGASLDKVEKALKTIDVQGFKIEVSRVKKAGLDACDFNVILDAEHENHDHDMEFLHGHSHEHHHEHEHHHDYEHQHEHHHHDHVHRGRKDVFAIIDSAIITHNARCIAKKIFNILAEAEAKAHGTTIDKVHFHEVGAVDSIVDIMTIAVCIDDLKPDGIILKNLTDGTGTIRCQHGIMPVPVPAVANVVTQQGLELKLSEVEGELVTPTGAAAAAALKTTTVMPNSYAIKKIGIGAGKRSYSVPSILRVMLLEADDAQQDNIIKLETNIDDCTGEALGALMDKLFAAGARDVYYSPIFMKKNRPAYELNVICKEENRQALENIIFSETTTIGIRRIAYQRTVLERSSVTIDTEWGQALVKVCTLPNGEKRYYPEYASVKALGEASGNSYQDMYRLIQNLAI